MTAVAGPVQGSIGMHQHVYALAASPNFAVDGICFAAGTRVCIAPMMVALRGTRRSLR